MSASWFLFALFTSVVGTATAHDVSSALQAACLAATQVGVREFAWVNNTCYMVVADAPSTSDIVLGGDVCSTALDNDLVVSTADKAYVHRSVARLGTHALAEAIWAQTTMRLGVWIVGARRVWLDAADLTRGIYWRDRYGQPVTELAGVDWIPGQPNNAVSLGPQDCMTWNEDADPSLTGLGDFWCDQTTDISGYICQYRSDGCRVNQNKLNPISQATNLFGREGLAQTTNVLHSITTAHVEQCLTVCHGTNECESLTYQLSTGNCTLHTNYCDGHLLQAPGYSIFYKQ